MNRFGLLVAYNKAKDNCTIMASGEYDNLMEFKERIQPQPNTQIMLTDFDQKEFEAIRRDATKINERFKTLFDDSSFADFMNFDSDI